MVVWLQPNQPDCLLWPCIFQTNHMHETYYCIYIPFGQSDLHGQYHLNNHLLYNAMTTKTFKTISDAIKSTPSFCISIPNFTKSITKSLPSNNYITHI